MSATVQAMMLKLVQRIDPYYNPGGGGSPVAYDAAHVGVYDGTRFPKQRQLDIYNDARYELLSALQFKMPKDKLSIMAKGTLKEAPTIHPASGVITLPTDYYAMGTIACPNIELYPVPGNFASQLNQWNPYRKDSADQVFLLPSGKTLFALSGGGFLKDTFPIVLTYWSAAAFTLSDVTGGTTTETVDDIFFMALLEIAEAISNETNRQELNRVVELQIAGIV